MSDYYCARERSPADRNKRPEYKMCMEELVQRGDKWLCPFHGEEWAWKEAAPVEKDDALV